MIFSRNGTEANQIKYSKNTKQKNLKNKSIDLPCFHPDWIVKSISEGELVNVWSYVVGQEEDHENLMKEFEISCRKRKIPGTRKNAASWIELFDAIAKKENKKSNKTPAGSLKEKEKSKKTPAGSLKRRMVRTRNTTAENASPLVSLSTMKIKKRQKVAQTKKSKVERKEKSKIDELCHQVDDLEQRDALIDASKCMDNVSLNDKKCLSRLMRLLVTNKGKKSKKKSKRLDDRELNFVEKCCRSSTVSESVRTAAQEVKQHLKLRALEGICEQMRNDPHTSFLTLRDVETKGLVRQVGRIMKSSTESKEIREASNNLWVLFQDISSKEKNMMDSLPDNDGAKKKKKRKKTNNSPPDDDDDDNDEEKVEQKKKKASLCCEICDTRKQVEKSRNGSFRCKRCRNISKREFNSAMYELSGNKNLAIEYLTDDSIETEVRISKFCFSVSDDACVRRLAKLERDGEIQSTRARHLLLVLGPEKSKTWRQRLKYLKEG